MTHQEWLVKWMELKAEYAEFPHYFNEEDKKQLLSLSTKVAREIVGKIRYYIPVTTFWYFNSGGCPFCYIVDEECEECLYGERHGVCDDDDSDYNKLRDFLADARLLKKPSTDLTNHLAIDPTDNPE